MTQSEQTMFICPSCDTIKKDIGLLSKISSAECKEQKSTLNESPAATILQNFDESFSSNKNFQNQQEDSQAKLSLNSMMSMSSLNEEFPIDFNDRIQMKNFQTIFDYVPFSNNPRLLLKSGSPQSKMTFEQKEMQLIERNRAALKSYIQMVEQQTVDIDEDSMDESSLPKANPPRAHIFRDDNSSYDLNQRQSTEPLSTNNFDDYNTKISIITNQNKVFSKPNQQSQDLQQVNRQVSNLSDIVNFVKSQIDQDHSLNTSYAYSELSSLCIEPTMRDFSQQLKKVKHKQVVQ
eukprot:403376690